MEKADISQKKLLCLATDFDRTLIFYNEAQNNCSKAKGSEHGDINIPFPDKSLISN